MRLKADLGLWHVLPTADGRGATLTVVDEEGSEIAHVRGWGGDVVDTPGIARLIAAAPRMYERIALLAVEGDAEAIAIVESLNASR